MQSIVVIINRAIIHRLDGNEWMCHKQQEAYLFPCRYRVIPYIYITILCRCKFLSIDKPNMKTDFNLT